MSRTMELAKELSELVGHAGENRKARDWTLMHLDLSEAIAKAKEFDAALQSHVDAIEADAARYRWLRDNVLVDGQINEEIHVAVDSSKWPDKWALVGKDLDAAIDAALNPKEADNG